VVKVALTAENLDNALTQMERQAEVDDRTLRDWPHDLIRKSSTSYNRCRSCGLAFTGYKWRALCRKCVGGGRG